MINKMAAFSCLQICLMLGMLITGSINTLSKKAQNDCMYVKLKVNFCLQIRYLSDSSFFSSCCFSTSSLKMHSLQMNNSEYKSYFRNTYNHHN